MTGGCSDASRLASEVPEGADKIRRKARLSHTEQRQQRSPTPKDLEVPVRQRTKDVKDAANLK